MYLALISFNNAKNINKNDQIAKNNINNINNNRKIFEKLKIFLYSVQGYNIKFYLFFIVCCVCQMY